MSTRGQENTQPETTETVSRAERYEPIIDFHLQNGRAVAYVESNGIDPDQPYEELEPAEKAELLAKVYNERRDTWGWRRYDAEEALDQIEEIMEHPEAVELSGMEDTGRKELREGEYPETSAETTTPPAKTGRRRSEPELQVATYELSGETEDEWIRSTVLEEQD